jgi:hypothetical protein
VRHFSPKKEKKKTQTSPRQGAFAHAVYLAKLDNNCRLADSSRPNNAELEKTKREKTFLRALIVQKFEAMLSAKPSRNRTLLPESLTLYSPIV